MESHRLAPPDLVRIFRGEIVCGLSDWQLLERYQERKDELAFEALVARHAPMVLGVCRRALGNPADVEDAFQATFLVLVRRAGHLGPSDAIGAWLHGVAIRVALRARGDRARRRQSETIECDIAAPPTDGAGIDRELKLVIDQELDRLPSKYRAPLVLCYLQDQTHEQAARLLQWPLGTVKGRLARARDLLRSRLVRRGLAPAATALAASLGRETSAEIESQLLRRTIDSALKLGLGQNITRVASTSVVALAQGVLSAMLINNLKWVGLTVLVSALALTGAGALARQGGVADARHEAAPPKRRSIVISASARPGEHTSADDALGSTADASNPRQELLRATRAAYQAAWNRYQSLGDSVELVYQTSRRWMEAQKAIAKSSADEVAAIAAHHDRIKEIVRVGSDGLRSAANKDVDLAQATAFLAESEVWLEQARSVDDSTAEPSKLRKSTVDPQSRRILRKLDDALTMNFATETPLDDVLKHIRTATQSSDMPRGIPIYVDPIGLQEAEKTLKSTVTIDLDGVPLRRTLQLVLKQLGLVYFVYDGMLHITSENSEDIDPTGEPSPLMKQQLQAERGELSIEEVKKLKELIDLIHSLHTHKGENGVFVPNP